MSYPVYRYWFLKDTESNWSIFSVRAESRPHLVYDRFCCPNPQVVPTEGSSIRTTSRISIFFTYDPSVYKSCKPFGPTPHYQYTSSFLLAKVQLTTGVPLFLWLGNVVDTCLPPETSVETRDWNHGRNVSTSKFRERSSLTRVVLLLFNYRRRLEVSLPETYTHSGRMYWFYPP